jgi:repressor LexA
MPRVFKHDAVVTALRKFFLAERRMPGYKEMLDIFGYKSKNSVFHALRILEEDGYLHKDDTGKIAPTAKLSGAIRLLGTVQAGIPVEATELDGEPVMLEQFLVPRPERTFMLKVRGDSMVDAGIHEGDYVLVETGASPSANDIVVACVDGEWTLKYYTREGRDVVLMPANKDFKPIRAKRTLHIAGVVRAGVRKYNDKL